jgi:glutamate dehydrogenase
VPNLDEDRILRLFLNVINATVRTNYFHHGADGQPRPYISFKFNPALVQGLPEPRPMFEIWVYSPRVEGVHLRGGRVARGGLRWSDRREDFRTEVLGLMKAQMVKNTVIVPVGSKGGFVVKRPPPPTDRDAFLAEGVACYQTFLRGLLDLTDNLVSGNLVPPPDVVRPTTTTRTWWWPPTRARPRSPTMPTRSRPNTASGSTTPSPPAARSATTTRRWASPRAARGKRQAPLSRDGHRHPDHAIHGGRHRRHVGRRVRQRHAAVAPHQAVAAFDHRHIFLDPIPTARRAWPSAALFDLPRSSWADYDATLISAGGGIYPRTAKTIALSPQVRPCSASRRHRCRRPS